MYIHVISKTFKLSKTSEKITCLYIILQKHAPQTLHQWLQVKVYFICSQSIEQITWHTVNFDEKYLHSLDTEWRRSRASERMSPTPRCNLAKRLEVFPFSSAFLAVTAYKMLADILMISRRRNYSEDLSDKHPPGLQPSKEDSLQKTP